MRTVTDMTGTVHSATLLGMGIVLADTARRGHHDLAREIAAHLELRLDELAPVVDEVDLRELRAVLDG
ncbi:hypothetical protein PQJ75_26610 [Rhodoplanes sp. TEM]|uniref:Uncharacterized protein n=1 Tax=Rhodoplanes tepidamans TaxID=200616 RepID=A0ABT5J736_RHOTP|nr:MULTISPECIES: hypothetical protein [Rhodoplanes]MDC7785475.1 hypothetical protein [Rhodoplanes tepidamans]MDC7987322.1 hypothetical protein [Rhodoplanes sp. TEM]MDQ0353355.1 hypothetical protein [Rhodoplanes tepidamans]